jgi:mono/diheme cytochrome c family protein
MRNFIAGIFAAFIAAAGLGAIVWIVVPPRIDWGASNPPGAVEQALARNVLGRWIHRNAGTGTNPIVPTAENLKAARTEYEAHCAACHNLDGNGRNRFEAEFNPPVAKLTGGVQKLSDSEVYFIVAHGIRNTAMPAFGKAHSSNDMWRAVLWVRHLGNLTAAEKVEIEQKVQHATMKHEMTMEHGMDTAAQPR